MENSKESKFMKSINEFVEESKKPNSIVNVAKNIFPESAKEIDKQLETFPSYMKKLEDGKMSYSEMRMLYG